jgi:uncharacterized protein YndB with AHSA1/START domain
MPIAPGLRRDVHLPAGTDAVWTAITDPDEVTQWFGASVEWDLRPGGRAAFFRPDGDREGRVEGVEPGRRLQFSWWPAGDRSQTSEVTYELQADDDGTRLTVTERQVVAPSEPGAPVPPNASVASSALSTFQEQTLLPDGTPPASILLLDVTAPAWSVADEAMLSVWASSQAVAVG